MKILICILFILILLLSIIVFIQIKILNRIIGEIEIKVDKLNRISIHDHLNIIQISKFIKFPIKNDK